MAHTSLVSNHDFRPVLVKFGEYDVTRHRDCKNGVCMDPPQIIRGNRIIIHPKCLPEPKWKNDIALIELSEKPKLNGKFLYI